MEGPITSRGVARRLIAAGKMEPMVSGGGRDCHPTKKRTRGRLRHFRDARRETLMRSAYEALLNTMMYRFARMPA